MGKKIILTGATGYVGEGVLLECMAHASIDEVLVVGRKSCGVKHSKVKELLVKDFLSLEGSMDRLHGYDAGFFCAGISSVGMKEADYTRFTHDATLAFAKALHVASPGAVFTYVSGAGTDSSEKGRSMWARVKGRTENDLGRIGFKAHYNFRPGIMRISPGQRNPKTFMRILVPVFALFMPGYTCTMKDVGLAMINCVLKGYPKGILEIKDIKALAKA
ncbi:MAG: NAD-dependent epimerase/dehydratase family protein [Flavobacteriales bacterium]